MRVTAIEKENGSSFQRARTLFESFKGSREKRDVEEKRLPRYPETKSLDNNDFCVCHDSRFEFKIPTQKRKRRVKSKNIIIVDNR